ncbi:hypothetical protein JDV02_003845 [Purpureocillium takamizusanense]|nr:uncharacterized protein JDV02_003845 [Purpureocillium takamizusanense]UNI17506.1 hypothetical protein JDV02_003845 [Purpureocillium takamizusanense]
MNRTGRGSTTSSGSPAQPSTREPEPEPEPEPATTWTFPSPEAPASRPPLEGSGSRAPETHTSSRFDSRAFALSAEGSGGPRVPYASMRADSVVTDGGSRGAGEGPGGATPMSYARRGGQSPRRSARKSRPPYRGDQADEEFVERLIASDLPEEPPTPAPRRRKRRRDGGSGRYTHRAKRQARAHVDSTSAGEAASALPPRRSLAEAVGQASATRPASTDGLHEAGRVTREARVVTLRLPTSYPSVAAAYQTGIATGATQPPRGQPTVARPSTEEASGFRTELAPSSVGSGRDAQGGSEGMEYGLSPRFDRMMEEFVNDFSAQSKTPSLAGGVHDRETEGPSIRPSTHGDETVQRDVQTEQVEETRTLPDQERRSVGERSPTLEQEDDRAEVPQPAADPSLPAGSSDAAGMGPPPVPSWPVDDEVSSSSSRGRGFRAQTAPPWLYRPGQQTSAHPSPPPSPTRETPSTSSPTPSGGSGTASAVAMEPAPPVETTCSNASPTQPAAAATHVHQPGTGLEEGPTLAFDDTVRAPGDAPEEPYIYQLRNHTHTAMWFPGRRFEELKLSDFNEGIAELTGLDFNNSGAKGVSITMKAPGGEEICHWIRYGGDREMENFRKTFREFMILVTGSRRDGGHGAASTNTEVFRLTIEPLTEEVKKTMKRQHQRWVHEGGAVPS